MIENGNFYLVNVFFRSGFFTPFVYVVDYSVSLGMDPSSSSVLLQVTWRQLVFSSHFTITLDVHHFAVYDLLVDS